ncbi:oligosaccharide flippase family protein [Sphingomonas piscis]|uniref:Oligosaccharide flippase family protein n=1 Tax=Sphingomonas piscis TaxID=2714943 RepID=A0A6G7YTC2_9SPHN|nr:oligosaccharide flippase family protein [Sphingomonas piscis]QIK79990.1 oligosaccharide flippase family protein [Sphingomonas piscis]
MAALARGGRINFFGFILRLLARLPFLFIAGRMYGAEALGRFAYAVLIVEFAAQIATLGLKRGLAQQLAQTDKAHACIAWDALLVAGIGSVVCMALLILFPQAMFPNSEISGLEWLLPISVIALAWSDITLAALAYRHDVGATVRARAIVEPWTISIVAFGWAFVSKRDGLLVAYALSMVGALIASFIPFLKSYGLPRDWSPDPAQLWRMARRNLPVAAADAVEWGSRRLDLALLGLFVNPAVVGIYYVAQNVASLPSKLKTSFDPILGPVISRNIEAGNKQAVAKQVRQVGFWVIAAQSAVALALAIPGEAVMGLVGPQFVAGTASLALLLFAEVVASTATVSESALIYCARKRNMMLSFLMILFQILFTVAIIMVLRRFRWEEVYLTVGPAGGLVLALAVTAVTKALLLRNLLQAPVSGWRWQLVWAGIAAALVGYAATVLPEWLELGLGIPAILLAFGGMLWWRGFTAEDRELFRMRKADIDQLQVPEPGTSADAPR